MPFRRTERDLLRDFQASRNILSESLDLLEQAHQLLEHADANQDQLVRAAKYRIGLVHEKVAHVRQKSVLTARSIVSMQELYASMAPSEVEAELRAVDAEILTELEPPAMNPSDPRGGHPDTAA